MKGKNQMPSGKLNEKKSKNSRNMVQWKLDNSVIINKNRIMASFRKVFYSLASMRSLAVYATHWQMQPEGWGSQLESSV